MILFGAPRLFSYQPSNNLSVHDLNGNKLKKRRRQNLKINRHRSPRSENMLNVCHFPNHLLFHFTLPVSWNENLPFAPILSRLYSTCPSQPSWSAELGSPFLTHLQNNVLYTANEGPVRIQHKCLVPLYVLPEMKLLCLEQNYIVLSSSSYTHISMRDLYISRIGLPILLQGNMLTDPGNI